MIFLQIQDKDEEIGNPRDDDGREIIIQDVLNAVAQKEDMDLEESCFKEVTTKNGKGLNPVESDSILSPRSTRAF